MKKHILIIPSWFVSRRRPTHGNYFIDQARALSRNGFKVGIIYPEFYSLTQIFDKCTFPLGFSSENIERIPVLKSDNLIYLPLIPYGKAFLWVAQGMKLYKKYIKAYGQPDVLHAHGAFYAGALASSIKHRFKIPYVITEHESNLVMNQIPSWKRRYIESAYRSADIQIAVSPTFGYLLEANYRSWNSKWYCIPNIVNINFEKFELNKRSFVNKKIFKWLSIGNLVTVKRFDVLLLAVREIKNKNIAVQLEIVGSGPLKDSLISLTKKLQINHYVSFSGHLSRSPIQKKIISSDAIVSSSSFESFGVVLLEAISCGKPIVSTSSGGPNFIVSDINGLLTPPGDPLKLADAMIKVQNNINIYDQFKIKNDFLERFGENIFVDKMKLLYAEL